MPSPLSHLFSPLALGPVELQNRIVSTAHQTTMVHENLPTDDFVAYHEARARGGDGSRHADVAHAGRLQAGDRARLGAGRGRGAAARDQALRPAPAQRARSDRELAASAGRRALPGPEPALPRRAPSLAGRRDRGDRGRLRAGGRAGGEGRPRRRRDLRRAQLPGRAVPRSRAEPAR
ncbi:MAG: hypothetical protein E6G67_11155 [Actinobacteria bacterium]|nr:MAG: hypothetical protein E6G67_11155 [Actinomycetota bacterium]